MYLHEVFCTFIHSILKKDENTKSLTNISKSASPRFGLEKSLTEKTPATNGETLNHMLHLRKREKKDKTLILQYL